MNEKEKNENLLKEFAICEGATVFGIAKTSEIGDINEELKEVSKSLPFSISIGVKLSKSVLETLIDGPNKLYFHHYKQINYFLDRITLRLTGVIENLGYMALPVAASQTVDWVLQKGHISHREVAYRAGLGFYGRNGLIVHPNFGAKLRFATVLTNLPLNPASDLINLSCGDCYACVKICPAGAIGNTQEEFNKQKCYEKLKEFAKIKNIGQYICGLCIKVCNFKREVTKSKENKL